LARRFWCLGGGTGSRSILKLDRIIEALPSDNEAIGAERAKEAEIQREIDAVEQLAKAEPATQPRTSGNETESSRPCALLASYTQVPR
jgi:low affinity Fe/Cu permease